MDEEKRTKKSLVSKKIKPKDKQTSINVNVNIDKGQEKEVVPNKPISAEENIGNVFVNIIKEFSSSNGIGTSETMGNQMIREAERDLLKEIRQRKKYEDDTSGGILKRLNIHI